MVYSIKDYPNYKVVKFPNGGKMSGVASIDTAKMEVQVYDYDQEEIVVKPIKLFGIDEAIKIIYLSLV